MAKNFDIPEINLRFSELFKKTGLSQKEFGALCGLSQKQISNIMLGRRGVTPMLVEMLKYKLNVSPDWLLEGEPPMFRENPEIENPPIPVIADIPAGDWRNWIDSYPAGAADSWISAPDVNGENLFAVRVIGDSMEPKLYRGDILVINPWLEFQSGIAVVRHKEGFDIRNVRKITTRLWYLMPQNPKYPDMEIVPNNDSKLYVPIKVISVRDI